MLTILRLNWPMYAKASAFATLGMLLARQFDGALRFAILASVACTAYWTLTSLAASWWIYDRTRISELGWLDPLLDRTQTRTWLNLHVGLDELDGVLTTRFVNGQTLDIFDPSEHTEPSILEARRQRSLSKEKQTNWRYLPAANQSCDAVILMFSAHEFRRPAARERLFIEVQRVLRDTGRVVLVEHLRDANNFAAFGPGAFHFFSRRSWVRATTPAGLAILNETAITPFVHAFVLGKRCAP